MLRETNREDFLKVHDIMESSFPEDERRNIEGQEALFDEKEYHIYSARDGEKIFGFISVWEFKDFSYIEHFAVDEKYRNGGQGAAMLTELVKSSDKPFVLEVELPESDITKRRIGFYERNNFVYNDYHYIQLPYSEDKNPVELRIMSYPKALNKEEFENVRDTLYKRLFGVENK